MNKVKGDIWDYYKTCPIVIPTNLGWDKCENNVMGAGLAKQAKERFPYLPVKYGEFLINNPNHHGVVIYDEYRLICFPTKRRNDYAPWMSWTNSSDLELIEQSCIHLLEATAIFSYCVAIPPVGCGCGGLKLEDVEKVLDKYLDIPQFFMVIK